MPVMSQKTRKKVAPKTKSAALQPDLEAQVDQLGKLQQQAQVLYDLAAEKGRRDREEAAEIQQEAAELAQKIREQMVQGLNVKESREVIGKLYLAKLGKEKETREITDPLKAFQAMTGAKIKDGNVVIPKAKFLAFLQTVKITLGALSTYLTGKQVDEVTEKSPGGPNTRQFKVEARS